MPLQSVEDQAQALNALLKGVRDNCNVVVVLSGQLQLLIFGHLLDLISVAWQPVAEHLVFLCRSAVAPIVGGVRNGRRQSVSHGVKVKEEDG